MIARACQRRHKFVKLRGKGCDPPLKERHLDRYQQIGLKISYYRKLRGMTQEQLAEALSLTPAFIGHVEAPGVHKAVSLDTLFDIADVLGVEPSRFLVFEEI